MYDLIIRNGKIVDGTGNPWFKADLALTDGKIVQLGKLPVDVHAEREIDATGMMVAPGFIDIHSHSDLPLVVDGLAQGKVRQGVTTEVIGNCGFAVAPILTEMAKTEVNTDLNHLGVSCQWETMAEYMEILDEQGISLNVVPLIGHGTIRKAVMGYEQRQASVAELTKMCQLMRECMESGAFGFSSGLIYPPSSYADTAELVQLAKVVAEYDGLYATHMRNESTHVYQAVEESIEIGRQSGIAVQISHHKACHPSCWGKVAETLALMHRVRDDEGIDVTCDVYPYLATNTGLSAVIPDKYHAGGRQSLLSNLRDLDLRETLLKTLETEQEPRGWHNLFISDLKTEKNSSFVGKNIETIAQELQLSPAQTVINLLIEEDLSVGMIRFAMCEQDVARVLQDDLTMVGSDGSALAITGPLANGKPHPRNFGTFPRVLGKYSRDEGILSMESAVKKMTSLSAARLGLLTKGLLRVGMDADITIFNPETVRDLADFDDPFQYPLGIDYVIVNGVLVIDNRQHTEKKPGAVLRKIR